MPVDLTKGVTIRIPKKGALRDCSNWHSITLLSVPSKILAKIIIKRISDAVDTGMRKEQAGFTLCSIIEQCTEWQRYKVLTMELDACLVNSQYVIPVVFLMNKS